MSGFFVQNFGCRASQADGAAIESQLRNGGLCRAADLQSADTIVLNTCTVTENADSELRHIVRRVHRENPEARIVITGCYAQRAPEDLAALPGVSMVVGNSHKTQLSELMANSYHGEVHVADIFSQHDFLASPAETAESEHARPNLKIQDGCNNRCSFCIIPFVRGRSRSAPVSRVVEQVRTLSKGFPEVVLTGINLGRWGREPGSKQRLVDLLRTLLSETDVQRLRLSSIEPMDWSNELLELVASSPRIAQHVHAPLQSGSDAVLRRMHRRYRPRHYGERIRLARALMPDAAIGADVMVGFPGETEQEFAETERLLQALPFTYLHLFPYSERPGTPAADRPDQVNWNVRKNRLRVLKQLGADKNLAFRTSMLGRTLPAVTLYNGTALTTNYLSVELCSRRRVPELIDIRIGTLSGVALREVTPFSILN